MKTEKSKKEIVHISIFGLIGVGKTTAARKLQNQIEIEYNTLNVENHKEPVKEWEDSGILDAFYKDPKRYGYSFQQNAFSSRLRSLKDIDLKTTDIIISDGHVLMDRYGFTEMLHEDGLISDDEYKWYLNSFKDWRKIIDIANPDVIIYLKTDVEIVLERIRKRARGAETGIKKEYLEKLQKKMEIFFEKPEFKKRIVIIDSTVKKDLIIFNLMNKLEPLLMNVVQHKIQNTKDPFQIIKKPNIFKSQILVFGLKIKIFNLIFVILVQLLLQFLIIK